MWGEVKSLGPSSVCRCLVDSLPKLIKADSQQNIVVIADQVHRSQYGFGSKANEKTG